MSQFREATPQSQDTVFRFEDRKYIEKLIQSKKLTDRQREALKRLYSSYNYMKD